jgi:hypothetical protein
MIGRRDGLTAWFWKQYLSEVGETASIIFSEGVGSVPSGKRTTCVKGVLQQLVERESFEEIWVRASPLFLAKDLHRLEDSFQWQRYYCLQLTRYIAHPCLSVDYLWSISRSRVIHRICHSSPAPLVRRHQIPPAPCQHSSPAGKDFSW